MTSLDCAGSTGIPRAIDIALAVGAMIVAFPFALLAAIAVRLFGGPGPVVFRQERVGRGGAPFILLKFRTMRSDSTGAAVTARTDRRTTAIGRLLRRTKLDEIPNLWNVLRGDMALVGPRPEVPRFVDLDDSRWQRVLAVRPGIVDPMTLSLVDEEAVLASVDDPEAYYERELLPKKIDGYLSYLDRRTVASDLSVLLSLPAALLRVGVK